MLGNFKTILTVNTINSNINKIKENKSSETVIKNKLLKFYRISKIDINSSSTILKIYEEKQTQTEEKFFMFHWKKFTGIYKIITAQVIENRRVSVGFPLLLKNYQFKYKKKGNLISSSSMASKPSQNVSLKDEKTIIKKNINKIGRNEYQQLNYIFRSYYDKTDYFKSLIIKNENKKIINIDKNDKSENKTEKDNTKKIINENYIESLNSNRIESIKKNNSSTISKKKISTKYVSGKKNIKENDFLNKYLIDEKRIINC